MFRLNPPENFNFSNAAEWPNWKERFARFRTASKLAKEGKEVQTSVLIYTMGKEAEHIRKTFDFADGEDQNDYETVLGKFNNYFVPKRNVIHERAQFHMQSQRGSETAENFVLSLYEIAEHCDFAEGAKKYVTG